MKTFNQPLSAYLRSERERENISIEKAADMLGITLEHLSECESGQTALATEIAYAAANLYNSDPEVLFAILNEL